MSRTNIVGELPSFDLVNHATLTTRIASLSKDLNALTVREIGAYGKDLATVYLERSGMKVVERGWKSVFGDVDLVARDGSCGVLCEVRSRVADQEVEPSRSDVAVGYRRRRSLERIALLYLSKHIELEAVRFDVISVRLTSATTAKLSHLSHVFYEVSK